MDITREELKGGSHSLQCLYASSGLYLVPKSNLEIKEKTRN